MPSFALDMLVAFGLPLAWCVWELISVRREQARDRAREAEKAADDARINVADRP